jgi:choline dehydrogenase-like flavoprotein
MASPQSSERTSFTLDTQGRFICNGLDEAIDNTGNAKGGRPFDVIIVGGGTFGSVFAQHLFFGDTTHSHRILVLEAGPYSLPEHVQNTPMIGEPPCWGVPWNTNVAGGFPGVLFTVGGRSIVWGGWSPRLLDEGANNTEMPQPAWPAAVVNDLNNRYFREASLQLGVDETNDFIYGGLHIALRRLVYNSLIGGAVADAMAFANLPDAPAVRFEPAVPPVAVLEDWLGIAGSGLPQQALRDLFKLEAPLAVQSQTVAGAFPFNKFSAIQLLIKATRAASTESGLDDTRKRLMVVPNSHVRKLNVVSAAGQRRVASVQVAVDPNDPTKDISVQVPPTGIVITALGTVETTRMALLSLTGLPAAVQSAIGQNLMAHLRSNLTIRVPRAAIQGLPAAGPLEVSALFIKGRRQIAGQWRHFHFQITATGGGALNTDAEAELFKKIPDYDQLNAMRNANDTSVVMTVRAIGEMSPGNPDSNITPDQNPAQTDYAVRKAWVNIGDARTVPVPGASSPQTQADAQLWQAMDSAMDQLVADLFAGTAYEILLPPQGPVTQIIQVPAGTPAPQLAALVPPQRRRDGLGSTHHDGGTLRMGVVTDDLGRVNGTTNAYVTAPVIFPTGGSPNPMLTGVALARRTCDRLLGDPARLPRYVAPPLEGGFERLFDGTEQMFRLWSKVGQNDFALIDGSIVTRGDVDHAVLYFSRNRFTIGGNPFRDFRLRLQVSLSNPGADNSGVFVRFRHPLLRATPQIVARDAFNDIPNNSAWIAVYSGFEVQIDEIARGDARLGEAPGLDKNRTGAIYKIPTGQNGEPVLQNYNPGPPFQPNVWQDLEIRVLNDQYRVTLGGTVTTVFQNPDATRGVDPAADPTYGYIGLQSYSGSRVSFRNIRIGPP